MSLAIDSWIDHLSLLLYLIQMHVRYTRTYERQADIPLKC